jgi:hypothetical protein
VDVKFPEAVVSVAIFEDALLIKVPFMDQPLISTFADDAKFKSQMSAEVVKLEAESEPPFVLGQLERLVIVPPFQ